MAGQGKERVRGLLVTWTQTLFFPIIFLLQFLNWGDETCPVW